MERNSEHEAADDTTPADSGSKVVSGGDDKTDDAEPGREASGGVSNGSKAQGRSARLARPAALLLLRFSCPLSPLGAGNTTRALGGALSTTLAPA